MEQLNIKEDTFLLVEGKTDQEIIWELRSQHKLPVNFKVIAPKEAAESATGKDALLKLLAVYVKRNDLRTVGIVIDSDDNAQTCWQAVSDKIKRVNTRYKLPKIPDASGTIIPSPDNYAPRLGIWLMPDNQKVGDLETFVRGLMPDNDDLLPFADKILNEIEANGLHRYRQKRSKAFIYTWLAWQKEPDKSMRNAIQERALLATTPIALQFTA